MTQTNVRVALAGPRGKAATIAIGDVLTLPPGAAVTVQNSGTATDSVLDFGIPQGVAGPAPEISMGTVVTGGPGSIVIATLTETGPGRYDLNLSIPRGEKGDPPTFSVGTIATGAAGSNAAVSLSQTGVNSYALNFTIPRGDTGDVQSHNHDDRYYTETETNNLLNAKLDSSAFTGPAVVSKVNEAGGVAQASVSGLVAALAAAKPGLVPLSQQSISSAVAAVDVSLAAFLNEYDEFELHLYNVIQSAVADLTLRTSGNNGASFDAGSADYRFAQTGYRVSSQVPNGTAANGGAFEASSILLTAKGSGQMQVDAALGGWSGVVRILRPAVTGRLSAMRIEGQYFAADANPFFTTVSVSAVRAATAAINALRLLPSTGNIIGGVTRLYGIRKS